MGKRFERTAIYLGLVRRPGEPDPVFTPRDQGRMAVVLVPGLLLLVLGPVLQATGRSSAGAIATALGLAMVSVLNLVLRRVRRRRTTGRL